MAQLVTLTESPKTKEISKFLRLKQERIKFRREMIFEEESEIEEEVKVE